MLKKSIRFPLIYFVTSIIYQWIKNGEVRWIESSAICFSMFLFVLLFHWAEKPYEWKRKQH
ncbi:MULTISPECIES: hypothetical protein [Bacillaceae]|uniref:hypothetical protein n=1 Tax=Bacillaceae TaxID=186817 RepID=UPI001C5937C6|nr:hypothetical protein [Rossellomorea sp. YZS02]MBW3112357.1 hypothetical protein [Bacillus sp. MCCB 382]MDX8342484.1 hypothetical protein [Rossellomorea sp. YZS02]